MLALVAIPALLGIAATQPALRSTTKQRVRTDAQAYFILDTSRSMLARKAPGDPTRLARARADAIRMRDALPEIPAGIATLTDRLLPDLLPNPDPSVFAQTIDQAVQIEEPPPASSNIKATTFTVPLEYLASQNFFPATIHNRLAVILTDGESNPVDDGAVARALATGPGIKVIFIHVWKPGEAVYDGNSPEQGYHEDPNSGQILQTLAAAIENGKSFDEELDRKRDPRDEGRRRHERPDRPPGERRADAHARAVRRPRRTSAAAADRLAPCSARARLCAPALPPRALRPGASSRAPGAKPGSKRDRPGGVSGQGPRLPRGTTLRFRRQMPAQFRRGVAR